MPLAFLLQGAGTRGPHIPFITCGNEAFAPVQLTQWQKSQIGVPSSHSLGTKGEGLFKMTKEVHATHVLTLLMSRTPAARRPPFPVSLHCWV